MMKTVLSLLMAACLFTACQRDSDVTPPPTPTTQDKVLGKWKLQQVKEDVYSPITVLSYSDVQTGQPGDSLIFKSNGKVIVYSDGVPDADTINYRILNSTSIELDGDKYEIKELTANKFRLYQDTTITALNMRAVLDVSLIR